MGMAAVGPGDASRLNSRLLLRPRTKEHIAMISGTLDVMLTAVHLVLGKMKEETGEEEEEEEGPEEGQLLVRGLGHGICRISVSCEYPFETFSGRAML